MAILPIVKYPDARLREPCADVAEITDDIRRLANDMVETMRAAAGIGLAAPQIGQSLRLMVADVSQGRDAPIQLANPQVVSKSGRVVMEEGCLSVPGARAPVARAAQVVVRGIGMDGAEQTINADELLAVCLQHEIDHLAGVLFFDHISTLRRLRLLSKYNKQFS